jgi:hypothetical protein
VARGRSTHRRLFGSAAARDIVTASCASARHARVSS